MFEVSIDNVVEFQGVKVLLVQNAVGLYEHIRLRKPYAGDAELRVKVWYSDAEGGPLAEVYVAAEAAITLSSAHPAIPEGKKYKVVDNKTWSTIFWTAFLEAKTL